MANGDGGMTTVQAAEAYLDLMSRLTDREPTRDERRLKERYLRILQAPHAGEPATKGLLRTTKES